MYGRQRYQKEQTTTAHPGDLVVMLYDGIVRFLDQAVESFESEENIAMWGLRISRAMDVIGYLQTVLDPTAAPELVAHLDALYTGWSRILIQANAKKDLDAVRQIRDQVQDMREAWDVAIRQVKQDKKNSQEAA